MSAITAKASRKMKKYAVLTREPRCFLGSFDFSWEQRKLSELTSMHARIGWQNLRTSEFLDSGNYMLITGTDFNDGAINFSTCHYVERERYEQDRNIQIHNGSILITKDGTLGKVAYVQGLSMPATLNAGVFNVQIKDANNVDEKYLFQYLKAPFLMDYVDKKATGGTIKHLNQSILVDFPVILPQRSEQTLIGAFFQQLDNLITLHQRKFEKLTNVKKSMLEKMFPQNGSSYPEIRFKGFTDPWEQRKAKELFVSTADKGYPELPVLSATQDRGMIRRDENSINIFHDKKNEAGYKRVLPGQFVIHLRSFQGGFAHSAIEGITSPAYTVFGFSEPEKHDSEYWKYVFTSKSFIQRLETVTYGIRDGRSISYEEFLTLGFVYPSKAEQTAIARYLDKLSDLITLHQRELEKLQNIKKSMLEKMFV